MGRYREKTKADELLTLRVRRRTLRQYERCRELLKALEGRATGDVILAIAFRLLAQRLRHMLGVRGIPLPPEGGVAKEPEPKFEEPPWVPVAHVDE